MNFREIKILLGLLVSITFLVGCSDDPVGIDPPPDDNPMTFPFPDSADQLLENFVTVYEDMDYGKFRDLLTFDYAMILQQSTLDRFPFLGVELDFTEELRIQERMFSGEDQTDRFGNIVPAISEFSFPDFRGISDWNPTNSQSLVPGAQMKEFTVSILVVRPGREDILVNGRLDFFAVSRDSVVNGVTVKYFQIAGLVDKTNLQKKGLESSEWGAIKGMFF